MAKKHYPFEISSQEKLHEKVTDMHKNPVERGLVERVVDYLWSSVRYWLEG